MGYKIIVKKRFANNLRIVLEYLESEWGKKVADDFHRKILATLDLLKSQPYIGSPSEKIPGARGLMITSHNRLFYRVKNEKIIIITLADTRRKNYRP